MMVNQTRSAPRTPATWKGIALAVLVGLVLGTLVSLAIVFLRPAPTGISHARIVRLEADGSPGQPWLLELEVDRSGYPYLIHVDGEGHPSLLFPDGRIAQFDPGRSHRLPDDDGHRAWRSEATDSGAELFVMLSGTPYLPVDRVIERAERAADGASSARSAHERVKKALRDQLGPGVFVALPFPN
jgi:hypothetical protein